jgi:nucleoside 2-deoxyribosyltransferase
MSKSIYVASPLGFSEAGRYFMQKVLFPLLSAHHFQIIDPWTLTDAHLLNSVNALPYGAQKQQAWQTLNHTIAQNNCNAIKNADALLAILDGTDVDSGTASEIGFAAALQKVIIGYRGDFRLNGDNEGAIVNLQVQYFIQASGGSISTNLNQLNQALASFASL